MWTDERRRFNAGACGLTGGLFVIFCIAVVAIANWVANHKETVYGWYIAIWHQPDWVYLIGGVLICAVIGFFMDPDAR